MIAAGLLVINSLLVPIIVAILAYIAVDRLGEWRKWRTTSILGVVIIESLQEEIQTGIQLMTDALKTAEDPNANEPPAVQLPNRSWSGMSTIPDDVLLRIIETSATSHFDGFKLRDCRSHCKNYFEHMCKNYQQYITNSLYLAQNGRDWRSPIRDLLADNTRADGTGSYIRSATKVNLMLQHAKQLLDDNSRVKFPK
jgi:hypothetical protein